MANAISVSVQVGLTGPVLGFYSNMELNHESDSQDQQPLHMSIRRQMAVCMTAVQKSLSDCQLVTKQATVTKKKCSWQLGSCHCHSLAIIHIWNWPVVQNGRVQPVFFSSIVFSHYLPLILHRDFTHLSVPASNLAIIHNAQRASDMSQVLPPYDIQDVAVCMHSGRNKNKIAKKEESMLGCHLIISVLWLF